MLATKTSVREKRIRISGFNHALAILLIGIALACGRLIVFGDQPVSGPTSNSPGSSDSPSEYKPMPNGLLTWNDDRIITNVPADSGSVHFVFGFTNISSVPVLILDIQPTCGCTTLQLTGLPWKISPGCKGQFEATVELLGKARKQTKFIYVRTDKGFKALALELNIQPPFFPPQSQGDQARALDLARINRQAIFHNACADCHVRSAESQDGKTLYYEMCSICHEAKNGEVTKTDLFAIKTPTNVVFWIDWIAHSKPGSLMPAFSTSDGGPLSEMQVANLARYLNITDEMDP